MKEAPSIADISREQQWLTQAQMQSYNANVDHYQKMMVLGAAVLGLVVPFLARTPGIGNPGWLRVAAVWLVLNVIAGALSIAVGKYLFLALMRSVAKYYQAIYSGDAPTGDYFETWSKRVTRLSVLGDLVFYGCFIIGLCCLLAALR